MFLEAVHGSVISIHALHEESDSALGNPNTGVTYFNPRSP